MIAQNRQSAIDALAADKAGDLEDAFNRLPGEQALEMLREADRQSQAMADGKISQQNADSWLTLHPEYHDDILKRQTAARSVTPEWGNWPTCRHRRL